MKYISEDNRWHSPASYLADVVYGKDNTKYSCGNGNLQMLINKFKDTGEEIVVYVDLVPGNYNTYEVFRRLLKCYKDYRNVYIVPILSTEACVVESLRLLSVELDDQILNILDAKTPYRETRYSKEVNLEKVSKQFYKDIYLLKEDLSFYKDDMVCVCGKEVSLEERGVLFILAHMCYISNDIISKYSQDSIVSLEDYIDEYVEYYNKLAKINGLPVFSEHFNYKKYLTNK